MIVDYDSDTQEFTIEAPPHMIMLAKRIWPAVARQFGKLRLSATISNGADLAWFLQRHCIPLTGNATAILSALQRAWRAREAAAEESLLITHGGMPVGMGLPLRDYQTQAFELTKAMGSLLLGDAMGLGKTAVGIALAASVEGLAIIICQTHVQTQWKREFAKFAPLCTVEIAKKTTPEEIKSKVLILPYSKCAGWGEWLLDKAAVVVLDECQEIRKPDSQKYNAVAAICRHRPITIGLSGTPVYNYGDEIFSILEVITPGCLGSRTEFNGGWCYFIGSHWVVREPDALGAFLSEQRLMLRRRTKDVARELPPIQRLAHIVEYDPKIMESLASDADQLARTILASTSFTEKGQASRELSIRLRQSTGIAKAPFVAEFVIALVQAGEKVVLGGWHREVYSIWQRKFAQAGVQFFTYTGTESGQQKDASKIGFTRHTGGAVFILSLRSGAGLDGLQHVCNTVVFGELDWSPQVHEQTITRVHRDGQKDGCTAIFLVSEAGSDPVIAGILGVKQEQGHGITDPTIPISEVPAAQNFKMGEKEFGTQDVNRAQALATAWLRRVKK